MKIDRTAKASVATMLLCSAALVLASWTPAAARSGSQLSRSGVPPFCLLRGGARLAPMPQDCRYYDYQTCLQAGADLNGNCIINMDYHGTVSLEPVAPPPRSKRKGL